MLSGLGFRTTWILVVVLQAVGIVAVATIGGPAAGLHVGRGPGLGPQRTQKGGRMEGAGTDLGIERLQQYASLLGPIGVQALDDLLEGRRGHACTELEQSALV